MPDIGKLCLLQDYLVSMDGRDFSEGRDYTAYKDTYWSPLMIRELIEAINKI